jgi:hypothetical protein
MTLYIKVLIVPASILVILLIGWIYYLTPDEIVQPIAYNHKIHIEEVELGCIDCHIYYEESVSATFPSLEICSDCHGDEPISDSPEEIKLIEYLNEEVEIPWRQIYNVPDHVYFSHRRHVVLGELDCNECHGEVTELTKPAALPLFELTMDNCMDCHKEHNITNDCLSCHR